MSDPQPEQEIAFAREKAKRTLPVALLVLLGLVAMYLPLPKRAGRERVWPVVTLVIVGMLLSMLALQVAFYGTVSAYEACLSGAQTK